MKKNYTSPSLVIYHLDVVVPILAGSTFDGNIETPQDLILGDDNVITDEDDIG